MSRERARTYLTPDIPGIGGVIKEAPEDFHVEEIPSYLPCGEGEHLYLQIEKRGITTLEAIRRIARLLKVQERDVGYAGLKDARGITIQTISIPRVVPELALSLEIPGIRPLAAARHRNKLKRGHLAGNRFTVTVRGVSGDAFVHAEAVLETLSRRGVPNIFGPQRYGIQGNSHLIGRALISGDHRGAIDALVGSSGTVGDERWKEAIEAYYRGELQESIRLFPAACRTEREILQRLAERPDRPAQALHAVNPRLKSLYLSAWQSELFDRLLLDRIDTIDRIETGDLAWKHANGACFLVEDPAGEGVRAASFEISPTGPLFGSRMTWPSGAVRCREETALAQEQLAGDITNIAWPPHLEGARRPYRVPLSDCGTSRGEDHLKLGFSLPKGSYATAVLREVMKDW